MKLFAGVNFFSLGLMIALCVAFVIVMANRPDDTLFEQMYFFAYKLELVARILFSGDDETNNALRALMYVSDALK